MRHAKQTRLLQSKQRLNSKGYKMKNGDKPAHPVTLEGLTKREYFAAMAMQGILANRELQVAIYEDVKFYNTTPDNALAFHAVMEADKLLKQLEQ